jgi:sugar lactone lactonase YvrE
MKSNRKPMSIPLAAITAALRLLRPVAIAVAVLMANTAARATSNYATPYTISTLAGHVFFPTGADGTGSAANFIFPAGVAADSMGNLYVTDNGANTVRKITPAGVVTTLAGSPGVTGSADGTGSNAQFSGPFGITVDSNGIVYVADRNNGTIRKVTQAGVVTTFVGTPGVTGHVDGTGSAASFGDMIGLTIDGSGNLFVADDVNSTIRKVTPSGVVTTFAGTTGITGSSDGTGSAARFNSPYGVGADHSGNVYVADTLSSTIRAITPSGVVTTLAGTLNQVGSVDATGTSAKFTYPTAICADSNGNLYVADYYNQDIRKVVVSSAAVSTLAGSPAFVGYADGTGTGARFNAPFGIVTDSSGNIYLADSGNTTVRKITASAVVTTVAGSAGAGFSDGAGSSAGFFEPTNICTDPSGNMYVADESNHTIRKVTPGGVVTTFAGSPGASGSSDGTGSAAQFYYPFGVASDAAGNIFVADRSNHIIRKITPAGVVTTIAGTVGKAGSVNGAGTAAEFNLPEGITVDANGNIFVAEGQNDDVRMISSSGTVTTLAGNPGVVGSNDGTGSAAQFNLPAGVAVDGNDNVYVADYGNNTVRKITSAGVTTTIAGQPGIPGSADGTGTAATFYSPTGIAIDPSGNLYIAEESNNTIRKITQAGVVTTLAGVPYSTVTVNGQTTKVGIGSSDGTGSAAEFDAPDGITLDSSGNIYVADTGNGEIRKGYYSTSPVISTQPLDQFVSPGGSATFTVAATGAGTLSYQWNYDGTAISGATGASYTVTNAQLAEGGQYSVTVTNANGSATSTSATLYVNQATSAARLTNLSTRVEVGTGANILIVGFEISGTGTETLLIRGDGPVLAGFGVTGALATPTLSVYKSNSDGTNTLLTTNTGWGTNSNATEIANVSAQVGAFALPSGSADCAILTNLAPGPYTVEIAGVGNTTGVALAEVYEVSSSGTRLTNLSTRAQVGTGANVVIAGFEITGSSQESGLFRGSGPVLANFGLTGLLKDPELQLYKSNSDGTNTLLLQDIGWAGNALIASTAAEVGAFSWGTVATPDSAILDTLPAGPYTVEVQGASGDTGLALVEVYEVPQSN